MVTPFCMPSFSCLPASSLSTCTRYPSPGEAYCARPGWWGHMCAEASGVWIQEPVDDFLTPITDTLLYTAPLNLKFYNSPFIL